MRDASIACLREIGVDNRRLQRPVRGQPRRRPHGRDRDEPARVALIGAGLEGDRLPDRQGRGQARGRLHARRARQRHHQGHAGLVRADHRLYRHQDSPLRVREIQRGGAPPHDLDEVGRRGHGDRPHLRGIAPEGAARPGDRPDRARRDRDPRRARRRQPGTPCAPRWALPTPDRLRVVAQAFRYGASIETHPRRLQDRSLVPRAHQGDRRDRGRGPDRRLARRQGRAARAQAPGFQRCAARHLERPSGSRDFGAARPARHPSGVQAHRHLRGPSSPPTRRICTRPTRATRSRSTDSGRPNARRCRPTGARSSSWAAAPTASARASSSTIAASMPPMPSRRSASRPSWSIAIPRPCRPTTTPPTGCISSR